MRSRLGVEVGLKSLFEEPTVSGMAKAIRGEMKAGASGGDGEIVRVERDQPLPLSYAQQRLWFIQQLEPESAAYNIPLAVKLTGALNLAALSQSLMEIVRRHEALRTRFESRDGLPIQVIERPSEVEPAVWDVSELEEADGERIGRRIAADEGAKGFDLEQGPMWRAGVVRMKAESHVLVLTMHHVVTDGWSMGILVKEFTALYRGYREGGSAELAESTVQYADFAVWQRQWLQGEILEEQLAYWRRRLEGAPVLDLPTDWPRPTVPSHRGASVGFTLSEDLTQKLKELSGREGVTLFITLLAGFQALLARYTGQGDITVGTPIAGRNRAETEGLIGFFVNTLVMRTDLSDNPTVREMLRRVRETALGAYAHQDLPFEKLVEELQPERSLNREPLFQVMLAFQNPPRAEGVSDLLISHIASEVATANFDMTLSLAAGEERIRGSLEYAVDLYERKTIERLLRWLTELLGGIARDGECRVADLPLLTKTDLWQIVEEWNDTSREYPLEMRVQEIFELQTARSPDRISLVYEQEHLSYEELNKRSNQLGGYLRRQGVGPEVLVGLCVERSAKMVIGLLGIIKGGGAYVPLDPSFPKDRLDVIVGNSQPLAILTQKSFSASIDGFRGQTIDLDSDWDKIALECDRNLVHTTFDSNLIYVIHTSGTTGVPKGAMNHQAGILNRLLWMQETCLLNESDRVLQKTPFSFDVSVWEFFWPIMTGACLVVARPEGHRDSAYLAGLIADQQVTTVHFVPSILRIFLEEPGLDRCACLKRVICSGEALPSELKEQFYHHLAAELYNLYGPTEAAVDVTYHRCDSGRQKTVPIGRPIHNVRIYLTDQNYKSVPAGAPGDLYIGGIGPGRGYLNNPGSTAEKFIPNPFGRSRGERLYKTGDLARYSSDGRIEFLGRHDFQVKIRGLRIEIEEIESALLRHEGVRGCAVCVREDKVGGSQLVAYVAALGEAALAGSDMRRFLLSKLPDYMVPSTFIFLPELPTTSNGKLDRKALPAPAVGEAMTGESERLRTPVEEITADIWAEVLGLDEVGPRQSFFELGGHSLLAIQVISRIRHLLGVDVPLRALFENPTVTGLASAVERKQGLGLRLNALPLRRAGRDRDLPLSYAQQRLWFIQWLEPDSTAYNIPIAVRIRGEIGALPLEQSLRAVAARHEALRTRFLTRNRQPVQVIDEPGEIELPVLDLSDLAEGARERVAREMVDRLIDRPFDLEHGPMWRAGVIRIAPDDCVLLLCLHHVVTDGWSMGILIREIIEFYQGYREGRGVALAELPVQYADFAVWQKDWLQKKVLEEQLDYWRKQLAGAPVFEPPRDRTGPKVANRQGGNVDFSLSPELVRRLRAFSRQEGVTLFTVVLAAFQIVLSRHADRNDVVIGTSVAGRNLLELEGLIGFFVNQLVLRTDLSDHAGFRDVLRRAWNTLLGAYAHQDVPFEKLVEDLALDRDLSRTPLFQIKIVFQNAPLRRANAPRGLRLEPFFDGVMEPKFGMLLMLTEGEDRLTANFSYSPNRYSRSSVELLAAELQELLNMVTIQSDISPASLKEKLDRVARLYREAGMAALNKTVEAKLSRQRRNS
jgi:amino acid adenylation domain-containing protein